MRTLAAALLLLAAAPGAAAQTAPAERTADAPAPSRAAAIYLTEDLVARFVGVMADLENRMAEAGDAPAAGAPNLGARLDWASRHPRTYLELLRAREVPPQLIGPTTQSVYAAWRAARAADAGAERIERMRAMAREVRAMEVPEGRKQALLQQIARQMAAQRAMSGDRIRAEAVAAHMAALDRIFGAR